MNSPSTNGNNGRNTNGQFAKGNKHGTGNPYARQVAQLRSMLLNSVGETGLADIVQGLVTSAKGGDVAAAKLLLSYLLGKPTDAIEPDAVQIHEKQLRAKENDIDHDEQLAQVLGLLRSDL